MLLDRTAEEDIYAFVSWTLVEQWRDISDSAVREAVRLVSGPSRERRVVEPLRWLYEHDGNQIASAQDRARDLRIARFKLTKAQFLDLTEARLPAG